MTARKHARGFFDIGRFRWVRGRFTVDGTFGGEPRWDKLLTSQEGRLLLACARDWPLLPPGVAEEPDWRNNGGLLVSPREAVDVYEAYREIPEATPPVYQSFANLSLNDLASLIGFAQRWGPPVSFGNSDTPRRVVIECPVLVMAYHARVLWLSIRLLTAIRRPHLSDLPDFARWGELLRELKALHAEVKSRLMPADLEPLPSSPKTVRWQNTAQFARNSLRVDGLLKSNSPRGVWEVTDKGREALGRASR